MDYNNFYINNKIIDNKNINNKLGYFIIPLNIKLVTSKFEKILFQVKNISQEDIADGWQLIIPSKYKKYKINNNEQDDDNAILDKSLYSNEIHHFNISLSELPPHLWNKPIIKKYLYSDDLDENNCFTIQDKIYIYSINKTEDYEQIYSLYNEFNKIIKNNNYIINLYNYCYEHKIKGWLMIKVNKYISELNN
jgi:hypothetical protein